MSAWKRGLLGLLAGYVAGAGLGGILVSALSSNTHDKSLEVVMTAIFAAGPLGAVLGCLAAVLLRRG